MAKEKSKKDDQKAGGGFGSFMVSAIIALLLGIGAGGAFGYFAMPEASSSNASSQSAAGTQSTPPPPAGRFPNDAIEIAVPSVIADLASGAKVRARLDVSIVVVHGTPETTTLVGEVREDVIAYLKGLSLSDIEGVRGFQNLREQLDDRARIRGRGAILGLLIGGLVLE
ncbi:MAG TPA: flagellar basal body protein FliL [Hyphomicrobium sp.]|nr:flagellar basal body protein FliL [Hyphomicrobium sp.]